MNDENRRSFLKKIAGATGAVVLAPVVTACTDDASESEAGASGVSSGSETPLEMPSVPRSRPAEWDPIAFNRARGNAGAIPESYHDEINGPDGENKHLGKHLPYVPELGVDGVPEGYVALMWGDPGLGHTRHPNAVPGPANDGEGHWYDWVRIRKATEEEAAEQESQYPSWPGDQDEGFLVYGGGDITADDGKNTIYLAALPPDVQPGDTVRIYAHCLTHGEYVDFLTLPA